MSADRCEVAVVGGGIVGASATLALAREGFDVQLVERAPHPPAEPQGEVDARVYALAPSSVRWLRQLGVWPPCERSAAAYRRMQVWEAEPAQAMLFDAAEAALPQLGHILPHDVLLSSLWARLGAVRCRLGAAVQGIETGDRGVRLTLSGGAGIQADLVLAADGAGSPTRRFAGIDVLGWPYEHHAIVCHVETERSHGGTAFQRFMPEGPLAFLPLADGRSSIVWSSRNSDARMRQSEAEFARELYAVSQDCLGQIGAMTARRAVPLRLQHAQDYARPGLALLGDAAHVVHPLAGQGLNLGLADAECLVSVVGEARRARRAIGSARVLARYARPRKAANLEMLALTDALYRLFGSQAPGLESLRGLGLAAVDRLPMIKLPLLRRAVGL